jgi:site-specific DNA-methyltransferase (adenine-specific)
MLYLGDCLEVMPTLATSVDLILCDLPYGTTACKWDAVIPFEQLWAAYRRLAKPSTAIVLTASQPFTSALIMSNTEIFKYEWVWDKVQVTGYPNVNHRPLGRHESICVFYAEQCTYNAQKTTGHPVRKRTQGGKTADVYGGFKQVAKNSDDTRFPTSIITITKGMSPYTKTLHPTQKPVALMEYLIRTYTNEGDTVLDNCMGSGTTGVACKNTGRKFIGIERDPAYFEIARKRIEPMPWEVA